MTPDPGSLLPVALGAADIAADMMRKRPPASVTEKHDRDIVSDVDIAIEREIRRLLAEATPDIAFLGEEEGRSGTPDDGWLWTVDPIDGTSNFAHGIPLCASTLALLRNGTAVIAVIDAPFLGQRFHAVEGQGSFSGTERLSVSTTKHLRDAIVAIGDYATGPHADRENELRLAVTVQLAPRVHRLRMLGTAALDLAWVGAGHLDGSITLGNNPWDTAAGVLITREAGGKVMDAEGNEHSFSSAFTIAAGPSLIDQLILLVHGADTTDASRQDRQVGNLSPYAALDAALLGARYLFFDFDGPICDLAQVMPPDAADRLRALARQELGYLPSGVAETDDLSGILAAVAAVSSESGAVVDAAITEIELSAAAGAGPSGYAHETIAACRDSGRTPVIVSRHSGRAVDDWLARYGLDEQIRHVFAVGRYPPGHLASGGDQAGNAVEALGATAGQCVLITASPDDIRATRARGVRCIGYAPDRPAAERLTAAGADAVVLSLADLTLRMRARPQLT